MFVTKIPIIATLLLVAAEQPQTVTVEDFLRKECEAGKQESCVRAEHLSSDLIVQKRLEIRSVEFWKDVNTQELMLDKKKPDLAAAYPLVMHDYIRIETEAGNAQTLLEDRLPQCARHYLNGTPPTEVFASPVYADYRGLPPLLVHAGSREVMRDDASRIGQRAAAAGIKVNVEVYDGMPHVFQGLSFLPESRVSLNRCGAFIKQQTNGAGRRHRD